MQVNPLPPPPPPTTAKMNSPAAVLQMQSAVTAAAQTAPTIRTQTIQAPPAVGKVDAPRKAMTGTETGQSTDTMAMSLHAKSQQRGRLIDVKV